MNILEILTLVLWSILFVVIGAGLLVSNILFKTLDKKYPKYYKKIGRPSAFVYDGYFPMIDATKRAYRANGFLYSLMFRGIPRDFPKDKKLRKLANICRYITIGVTILAPIVFYCFINFLPQN